MVTAQTSESNGNIYTCFQANMYLCLGSTLNMKSPVSREWWRWHYRYRSSSLRTSFTFVNGMHCTKKMYTSFSETLQSIRVLCTATRKSIISASNCRSQKSPVQSISETVNLHSTQYFQVNKTKQQQKMLILLPRLQPNFTHTSTSQAPIQINSKKSQRCSNRDNLSTL